VVSVMETITAWLSAAVVVIEGEAGGVVWAMAPVLYVTNNVAIRVARIAFTPVCAHAQLYREEGLQTTLLPLQWYSTLRFAKDRIPRLILGGCFSGSHRRRARFPR
jgi:hypothetical protein